MGSCHAGNYFKLANLHQDTGAAEARALNVADVVVGANGVVHGARGPGALSGEG